MTERSKEELAAIQAVVDRVTSYQDGATERTVHDEMSIGLAEAGVALGDDDLDRLVSAIADEHRAVDVTEVL